MVDEFVEESESLDLDIETPKTQEFEIPKDEPTKETTSVDFDPLQDIAPNIEEDVHVNIYADLDAEEDKLKAFSITPENLMDTKYLDTYKRIMQIARMRRNRMYESEFEKYIPLFKQDNMGLNRQAVDNLYSEWSRRVSLYDPVEVFNNRGERVRVIPASFARADLISNNLGPEIAANIINGLNFAHSQPNDIHNKQGYWSDQTVRAFRLAQNKQEKERLVKQAEEQSKMLLQHNLPIENTDKIVKNETAPSDTLKQPEVIIDEDIEEFL